MWDDLYYLPPLNMTNVERARLSRVIERHDRRHRGVLCRLCMSAGLHVHVHVHAHAHVHAHVHVAGAGERAGQGGER